MFDRAVSFLYRFVLCRNTSMRIIFENVRRFCKFFANKYAFDYAFIVFDCAVHCGTPIMFFGYFILKNLTF